MELPYLEDRFVIIGDVIYYELASPLQYKAFPPNIRPCFPGFNIGSPSKVVLATPSCGIVIAIYVLVPFKYVLGNFWIWANPVLMLGGWFCLRGKGLADQGRHVQVLPYHVHARLLKVPQYPLTLLKKRDLENFVMMTLTCNGR